MLAAGADGLAFDPIVLAGAASADPHGTPSPDRRLERGQPLLVDFGAACGGYMADITRTFFVGSASARAPRHLRGGARRQRARPRASPRRR